MKKITFGILPVIAGVLLSGCASNPPQGASVDQPATTTTTVRTTRTVTVNQAPPPARVEVETPSPGPTQSWVQGYWMHSGDHWVWLPGHWEMRPREGATWVAGHWDKDPHSENWIWTEGHWQ